MISALGAALTVFEFVTIIVLVLEASACLLRDRRPRRRGGGHQVLVGVHQMGMTP
jgi:hypothetical protein